VGFVFLMAFKLFPDIKDYFMTFNIFTYHK